MIGYITGYLILGLIGSIARIRSLLYNQKRKEAAVYGCIMAVSLAIGSLQLARWHPPSFILPVQRLLEPVGRFLLAQ
ncbi:hypothetical protein [Cohnella sp. JJ-181]|uniref:hypothetical protein n=1 Tax=Cohnella rhizoplanae TaxID=2974897 RepID=UPI0022FF8341|nr:hypothetical protein [Cohnella sp. JJ-181]CAI6087737.1 hypothetical protein COHCIP112018_05673 [Cohnella sp. JJ-181]